VLLNVRCSSLRYVIDAVKLLTKAYVRKIGRKKPQK
jgi:hypothetical protein